MSCQNIRRKLPAAGSAGNILELSHVEKIYGEKENQVKALKDINIQVKEGEFIAIVGTSGSGCPDRTGKKAIDAGSCALEKKNANDYRRFVKKTATDKKGKNVRINYSINEDEIEKEKNLTAFMLLKRI